MLYDRDSLRRSDFPLLAYRCYIGDSGTYIARYDDLFTGKEEKIDVSKVDVSMNGIELQDREFFAAIHEGREPNASVQRCCPVMSAWPLLGLTRSMWSCFASCCTGFITIWQRWLGPSSRHFSHRRMRSFGYADIQQRPPICDCIDARQVNPELRPGLMVSAP